MTPRARARRPSVFRRTRTLLVVLAGGAFALAGCGERTLDPGGQGPPASDEATTTRPPADSIEYAAAGMAFDDGSGPMLCSGSLESYPPQCPGGVAVSGLDWSDLPSEEADGTRWADTAWMVGTVDEGTDTLHLTRPASSTRPGDLPEAPELPEGPGRDPLCDDPYRGGDESAVWDDSLLEDFDQMAVDHEGMQSMFVSDNADDHLNIEVDDASQVEPWHARAREVWSGFLCVGVHDAEAAAEAEQEMLEESERAMEAHDAVVAAGVEVYSSGWADPGLSVTVRIADPETVATVEDAVQEWYDADEVRVSGWLNPIE